MQYKQINAEHKSWNTSFEEFSSVQRLDDMHAAVFYSTKPSLSATTFCCYGSATVVQEKFRVQYLSIAVG